LRSNPDAQAFFDIKNCKSEVKQFEKTKSNNYITFIGNSYGLPRSRWSLAMTKRVIITNKTMLLSSIFFFYFTKPKVFATFFLKQVRKKAKNLPR
jgi:hypothetical protein